MTGAGFQPLWLLFGLAAGMLFLVALRLLLAPENAEARAKTRRMRALAPDQGRKQIDAVIRHKSNVQAGRVWPLLGDPDRFVQRAGLRMSARRFVALLAAGVIAAFAVGVVLSGPLLAAPLAGLAGLLPVAVLKARARRRLDGFVAQLPDALDLMMRGLRVGHPVSVTIANVGRTMPDPIGAEFRRMAEEISHGEYLSAAFTHLAERMDQEDTSYLAVSISIQHGTGGNLAEMMGTLARVIRERIMMRRRIRAISSEGRLSGWLLSALPVAIYAMTSLTAPDYYAGVSDDPLFVPIMVATVGLVVANFVVLRRLVNFQY